MIRSILILCISLLPNLLFAQIKVKNKPNIVLLYADDLGYGDVGCYGAKGVETPNIDKLANEGIKFTDAHCSSSTCTPSRYSLLTGQHAFRKNANVLPGDASLIIPTNTNTIASILKNAGYTTGIVGKWHLGLGSGAINWNKEIKPGPLEIGFDYSFLIPATGDRVPCVFVENRHVVNLDPDDPIHVNYKQKIGTSPTGIENPELLKMKSSQGHNNTIINGIGRIGYMTGGEKAIWKDEDFADILTDKAVSFIKKNSQDPFFLMFSFHDIHVPRVPNPRFVGKSTMGPRGDAIVQMDWCVGEVIKTLESLNLSENTLIIFTSDNGPVLDDGYADEAVAKVGKHKPGGPFRGGKYSILEAGTRVPFITYWPSRIKEGVNDALISQIDLLASFAALINQPLDKTDGLDSYDMLEELLGKSIKGRSTLIEEAHTTLGIRLNNWKYIEPKDGPAIFNMTNIESGLYNLPQLYNLKNDIGEKQNLASQYPEKVKEMKTILQNIIEDGYSGTEIVK